MGGNAKRCDEQVIPLASLLKRWAGSIPSVKLVPLGKYEDIALHLTSAAVGDKPFLTWHLVEHGAPCVLTKCTLP